MPDSRCRAACRLPRRVGARLLQVLPVGLALAAAAQAQTASTVAESRSALSPAAIVLGIVRYTRWPADGPLRLCVGEGSGAELRAELERSPDARGLEVVETARHLPPPAACAVLLFDGWPPAAHRETLRRLAGQPVLTIGWGHEFCSDGGMFCLRRIGDRHSFEVNLDAVAHGGLRVHPQVLRLARPGPKA